MCAMGFSAVPPGSIILFFFFRVHLHINQNFFLMYNFSFAPKYTNMLKPFNAKKI